MKRTAFLFLLAALLILLFTSYSYPVDLKKGAYVQSAPRAQSAPRPSELAVSVNLVGEKGDVYKPGQEIRFSFQTTKDAYVVIYNIDSEGRVHLLWPEDGKAILSNGRKAYFVPDPAKDTHWETGDKTGIEYIHALAVPAEGRINTNELSYLATNDRLSEEKQFQIDLDPFLAFNSIDEELVTGAEQDPPATDYTYFYINKNVGYPRYLCSKCHSPEKLPDPYAMQCSEVIIEKVAYDQDPHYPYPPLYEIRHVRDGSKEQAGSAGGKWLNEEAEQDTVENESPENTYLDLDYAYPYYPYRPFYEPFFSVYYWDPFWWDFTWSLWWGDFWWPVYDGWWGYCGSGGWGHHCGYPGWGCGRCGGWGDDLRYRPIFGERNVVKRYIDYRRTNAEMHRSRSLADSRLMRVRSENALHRVDRTDLQARVMKRGLDRTQFMREERDAARRGEVARRVMYGGDRTSRVPGRDAVRSVRSREPGRARGPMNVRSPRTREGIENRGDARTRDRSSRGRDGSDREINRSYPYDGGSSGGGGGQSIRSRPPDSSPPERSRSVDRPSSNVDRRRISGSSASSMQRSWQGGNGRSWAPTASSSSMQRSWHGGYNRSGAPSASSSRGFASSGSSRAASAGSSSSARSRSR